jgi:hypothetical protein
MLALSMAANAWLVYALVDGAMQLDDRDRAARSNRGTIADLRHMAERLALFPARLRAEREMKEMFPDSLRDVVKWEGDTLWVNEVGLAYRGDSVVRVVLMNEVN